MYMCLCVYTCTYIHTITHTIIHTHTHTHTHTQEIFYPTAFIFLLNATPGTGSAWFYFYSSKPPLGLGFSSTFLGTMNVVGSVANLAGIALFQACILKEFFYLALLYLLCRHAF